MEQVSIYFNAEKSESIVFISIGIIAIILSIYFLIKLKQPFYNGISYSLIAIAVIQLTVGASIFLRSAQDISRVENMIQNEPEKIHSEEIPRMEAVMNYFVRYRWIEIVLLIVGAGLFFYFQPMVLWKGLGLGLAIQAGIMLLLDYFAESRGKDYLELLNGIL